ncbi:hypothetical protein ACFWBF_30070 [Streptomyces sp. NPDC060028]|uniref:hypothetical protein n=1 Tax=Streptomyces sp. NPDC060028 TaxID=3347041 RepID=UPI0036C9D656
MKSANQHVQNGGRTRVLKAETNYFGALVKLIGHATIPTADEERSRAEAAS